MASPSSSTSASLGAATPVPEPRTEPSPSKRKALSPPEEQPVASSSSPSSPSTSCVASSSRRKPTDEERRVRLEARQARNRQSAQNSRERKKVYVEQLEADAEALRSENALLRQQQQQDELAKLALQSTIHSFESRVHSLEALLCELLKASGCAHPSLIVSAPLPTASAPAPLPPVSPVASLPAKDVLSTTASQAGLTSALIAAPASLASSLPHPVPSTSSSSSSSSSLLSDTDTRLPAAGVFPASGSSLGGVVAGNGAGIGGISEAIGSSIFSGSSVPSFGSGLTAQLFAGHGVGGGVVRPASGVAASDPVTMPDQGEVEQLNLSKFIDMQQLSAHASGSADAHANDDGGAAAQAADSDPSAASGAAGVSLHGALALAATASAASGLSGVEEQRLKAEQHGDDTPSFQLLTSPFVPYTKSIDETATKALLAEIYGEQQEQRQSEDLEEQEQPQQSDGDDSLRSYQDVSFEADSSWLSEEGQASGSMGSSPFDLVDLDVEIEQVTAGPEPMAAQGLVDWQSLFASIAA